MAKKYKVAVVGATGNVGRNFLAILDERKFPVSEVVAIASSNSAGKKVSFGSKVLTVQDLATYDFQGTDFALFSPGSSVSKQYAPIAAAAGCVVIDNTSYFRMFEEIPLVVPEVNSEALKDYKNQNIIANPNCSTAQMVVALKPLHDEYGIKRIVVSTYQSVSGKGKTAMDELFYQTKKIYENDKIPPVEFTKRIAFNCIPHIDSFMPDGKTKEEWKMEVETKKIIDPKIEVSATCVRVPVFVGHSESVNVEFERDFELERVYDLLRKFDGVTVVDKHEDGCYITPVDCATLDDVFVSRVRRDTSKPNCLNMWIVSDNLRKGAALNAIQIAEKMIEMDLV